MPNLSVIMPVLNGMPYFPQALESVQRQSLQELEIIVVDAGSTDGTAECIKEAMANDPRIRFLSSDQKSHGRQCNLGMKAATGEFVSFCESDDFVDRDMYKTLYETAQRMEQAEVIVSNYYLTFGAGEEQKDFKCSFLTGEHRSFYNRYCKYEQLSELQHLFIYMWSSIYRRDFIEKQQIWLNETPGAAFQDTGFIEKVKLAANHLVFLEDSFYHYRRDNDNMTRFPFCI